MHLASGPNELPDRGFAKDAGHVTAMLAMVAAKNEGLDNAEVRTPQNTTPTSLRQWCEEVLKPAVFA